MGPHRVFNNAQEIYDKAVEYLDHLKQTPLLEDVFVGRDGELKNKRHIRIPTWEGFAVYCKLRSGAAYFRELRKDRGSMDEETHKEIVTVLSHIGDMFYALKAEAASAGLANPSFIIHELGLRRQAEQLEANIANGQLVIKVVPPAPDDED